MSDGGGGEKGTKDLRGLGTEDDEASLNRKPCHQIQCPGKEGFSPEREEKFWLSHAPSGAGRQDYGGNA